MIMNILVLLIVLGVAYAWMVRDAFSAFLHMLCVLIAGAIAFAFWEPLAIKLIEMSPDRGFVSFLESVAFGVALLVPFAVSTILLRVLSDKLVTAGVKNATAVDYGLGAVFGLATSTIVAGMLVIGIGSMRLSTKFFGYQPIFYSEDRASAAGMLVRKDSLWIPVDTVVSKLYGQLSNGSMSSPEPLSKWYPELELTGFANRISNGDGSGRNAIHPDDFKIASSYTVGNTNGNDKLDSLLSDIRDSSPQKYRDINSEPVTNGYLMGYVIEFESGAKERGKKGGQLVVSNGHARLIIENNEGDTQSVYPIATISESSENDVYGRWRFDSKDVFITSVGGKSRIPMAFEFVIPQGYTPLALSFKNIRTLVDTLPDPIEYASPAARDRVIASGAVLKGESSARQLDNDDVVRLNETERQDYIRSTNSLTQLMSTQVARRGLTINEDNEIVDGQHVYDITNEVGRRNAPQSKKLRVEKYFVGSGQVMIKVNMSPDSPVGVFSEAAGRASLDAPILLIDSKGNEYEAIGYAYTDSKIFDVRFTPGSTLDGLNDTPDMSKSRDDQKLELFFLISRGAEISHLTIGDVALARMTPPYDPTAD